MNELERHLRDAAGQVAQGFAAVVGRVRDALGGDKEAGDDLTDVDVAIEFAAETGDRETLRHYAALGNPDAQDLLVELAIEDEDVTELAHLADDGSSDALDVLVEFASGDEDAEEELRHLADGGSTSAEAALRAVEDE